MAQSTLDDVYDGLILLQDANLGIARQMADLEQQAADELEAAMAAIGNPASRAIARTFVTNARTLAAIMLSPMQTYQTAAGESMFVLVRRNIDLLRELTSYRAADPALDQAITRYTILQMQTQDMAEALQNGWTRYGTILKKAEDDGLLANNTFDPETQSWQLGNPVLGAPPQQNVAAAQTPATSPLPMTTAEEVEPEPAAEPEPEPEPKVVADAPVTPDPPDLASTVTPLEVPETVPVPTTTLAAVPNIEDQPAGEELTPETEERLAPEGPLEVAETMPTTLQMGDWTIATNPNGESIATAINLVADTRSAITSLSMACAPDQSVAYAINGAQQFDAYRIYADRSRNVTVAASSNVVLGPDADAMATTLAEAVAWAQQVPDSGRSLTLRTADSEGVLALFPPNGYLDARAAILSACINGPTQSAAAPEEMVTALPQDEPEAEAEPAPEVVAEPAAPEEEAEPVAAAPVAPVPRPPLDRTRLPALPPTTFQPQELPTDSNQPISLM